MGQQEGQSRTAPSYLKIISQPRLKQNRYAGLFRAYAYRHCTRRMPGVPGSAKRQFFNRGRDQILITIMIIGLQPTHLLAEVHGLER